MDELCENYNRAKDTTQGQACEMCRNKKEFNSGVENITNNVDWGCEQCEQEYTSSEDRKTCICE